MTGSISIQIQSGLYWSLAGTKCIQKVTGLWDKITQSSNAIDWSEMNDNLRPDIEENKHCF